MSNCVRTVVFKPRALFLHHVELDDVTTRSRRSLKPNFQLDDFARRHVAWQWGAAIIPGNFFFVSAQEMRAELHGALTRVVET